MLALVLSVIAIGFLSWLATELLSGPETPARGQTIGRFWYPSESSWSDFWGAVGWRQPLAYALIVVVAVLVLVVIVAVLRGMP